MKKLLILLPCLLLLTFCSNPNKKDKNSDSAPVASEAPKEEKIRLLDYAKEGKPLKDIIAAEYEAGRTPIVYFWASWCGPCREFKASLHDPLMEDALNKTTLIMIDLDADQEKEKYSDTYGVSGIPAFVKVDKTGEFIDLVDGGAWDENIPANMAPVLKGFISGTPNP